jgi:hypothetical protein
MERQAGQKSLVSPLDDGQGQGFEGVEAMQFEAPNPFLLVSSSEPHLLDEIVMTRSESKVSF